MAGRPMAGWPPAVRPAAGRRAPGPGGGGRTPGARGGPGARRGERFGAVMAAATARLPFGLDRRVPPTLLGFAVISSVTFTADLLVLTALHGGLRWPVPV